MNHVNLKQSKIIKESITFEKKWFGIKHIDFTIGDKVIENYEAAYRPGRIKSDFKVDGVQILPIFKRKDKSLELIVIANFRPPIGKFSIQFPAGILQDTNFEENALRELKEQTGYTAQRIIKIPEVITHCDPWKSSEGGILYVAFINEEDPKHHIEQGLESTQNIRVFTFKIEDNLPEKICEFAQKHNYAIQARTWSLILGLSLHRFL